MKEQEPVKLLSDKLLRMYTENNLNKITTKIIKLYKAKQHDVLKEIVNSLSDYVSFGTLEKDFRIGKYFTKLVIMYHPDRTAAYSKAINNATKKFDLIQLEGFNHIFITSNILNDYKIAADSPAGKSAYYYDHDFEPDPVLYPDTNNIILDLEGLEDNPADDDKPEFVKEDLNSLIDEFNNSGYYSFFELYTKFGLSDSRKVELSSVGMKNLNGIEDFIELKYLDLSGNKLKDITVLWYSRKLEELYLAYNQICSVTSLCNLRHLRILDLADNKIDDISDLYDLPSLEFVNLIHNPIPEEQIDRLRTKVKIVLF